VRDSNIGRITGTWGGILSGVAALITAVTLSIIDTAGDKAEKADDKAEMVLDLFRDRFNAAQSERERLQRELEYQRNMNAKLFRMISELRKQAPTSEPEEVPAPVMTSSRPSYKPTRSGSGGDALTEALKGLSEEDQLDLPEPPPEPEPAPVQAQLPVDLEELLPKK